MSITKNLIKEERKVDRSDKKKGVSTLIKKTLSL